MKKIILIVLITIFMAGCAALSPELKIDWSRVNSADLANLQSGIIALPQAAVVEAVADVLKAQDYSAETVTADKGTVTTERKHGVTFYGSIDYSLSCKVTEEAGVSKLNWSTISYISRFLTNTDPMDAKDADKWNITVYKRLLEKGVITPEAKPVEAAATAVPFVTEIDLSKPAKEK